MNKNHRPCPICGQPRHRQSALCRACWFDEMSTPERRAQQSEIRKGKPSYQRTDEHKRRMSESHKGKPSWCKGKKRPEHSEAMKRMWQDPSRREAARQRGALQAENQEWLLKIANALSGANNPNYQGLGHATGYAPGWGRGYRKRLRARAHGICEMCGKPSTRPLDLHHKDFAKTNHSPDNLMVLCRSCHKLLHFANSANT